MTHFSPRHCACYLSLALLSPFGAVYAQSFPPGTATIDVPPPTNDPADRLAANLVLMAQNPKNVSTLIDAGRSAIAVGDYDAALTFLAKAEELAPSNGRVKSALGAALVMVERPLEAIRLFNEASALGAPDADFVRDRGLAYDLLGDNRRAQRDYQLALRLGGDDEVTRRLALSLGISGDRDAALRLLDPLLRRQDPTGWRARAFVLAMNGSVREAEGIATSVMPAGMGDTMRPFLRRLALLNAVDRAHAVNFGTMPSDGARSTVADTQRLIPAPELATPTIGDKPPVTVNAESNAKGPRRRPGKEIVTPVPQRAADVPSQPAERPGFSDIFRKTQTATPTPVPSKPAQSAPLVSAPIQTAVADPRVGKRIGPVDPERLPVEVRPIGDSKVAPPPTKIVPTTNTAFNQPGDAVVITASPPAKTPAPVLAKAPEPEEIDQTASAVFEVPSFVVDRAGEASKPPAVAEAASPPPAITTAPKPQLTGPPPAVIIGGPPVDAAPKPVKPVELALAVPPPATPTAEPDVASKVTSTSRGLAGLLEGIEPEPESVGAALPSDVEIKLARLAAQRKLADAANKVKLEKETAAKAEKAKADREAAEAAALAKRSPARVWVQIATGANESGLGITWKRLREKAPDAFKGLSASYAPYKATNRVLVGPFKSSGEARTLVTTLGKAGVSSNVFSSEAGQDVIKIASK